MEISYHLRQWKPEIHVSLVATLSGWLCSRGVSGFWSLQTHKGYLRPHLAALRFDFSDPQIFLKFWNVPNGILRAQGKLIQETNLNSKNSFRLPLNQIRSARHFGTPRLIAICVEKCQVCSIADRNPNVRYPTEITCHTVTKIIDTIALFRVVPWDYAILWLN